jgi:hypothetical protein
MENQTKKCTCCGEFKELSQFSPAKTGKYGVTSRCKKCATADHRKRYKWCNIKQISDEELLNELFSRGYSGEIVKKLVI